MRTILMIVCVALAAAATAQQLPTRWDEAIPLGNGKLGALVWQKNGRLRMSLDRADLWDNRRALDMSRLTFQWVKAKWVARQYDSVQKTGDEPYDAIPYPTKIPAAALEWDIQGLGPVTKAALDPRTALCTVHWASGATLQAFVAATAPAGFFRFVRVPAGVIPQLQPPAYDGGSLKRLGYTPGTVTRDRNAYTYTQPISEGRHYTVRVEWTRNGDTLTGAWTIDEPLTKPVYDRVLQAHLSWWKDFWASASVHLPDSVMQRQWTLDRYKLGCVARKCAPPVTLQAVWTADQGQLPPWKGDVHNDLNTELSYWPAFSGNYREGGASFTDWLWSIKDTCTRFTRAYFGVDGLNVPGVCTLTGAPMGGWIQYSLSPTTAAWLAQAFYDQWRYWPDQAFLKHRAYPYLKAVATYLEHIGPRLPLSSSPEIYDNSPQAWFTHNTNFDDALMIAVFREAGQMAAAAGAGKEAAHWQSLAGQVPPLDTDATGLTIAPGTPLMESHRHMSPYMAIYPLGLLSADLPADKAVIDRSLAHLSTLGTREWVGYSFCWAGCLFARDYMGDSAARYLKIFATNFCSPNSFHLNGDQKGGQYSGFTYRPFTLEGNFAYAAGVQEMLVQSDHGYVKVFPAIPRDWTRVSFHHLRAEGGFLVDAEKDGSTTHVRITASQNGLLVFKTPEGATVRRFLKPGQAFDATYGR
jgi:alpha-L-fucosidase 2